MAERKVPSVGRIVHYYAYGTPGGEYPAAEARAAVVTEVAAVGDPESAIGVCVFTPSGVFFNRHTPFSAVPRGGCWGWPPVVPPVAAG